MLLPAITADRARRIAAGFAQAHILVVGDAMLDRFIVGHVTRISPEAPVPVVAFDHETHRIGGAANVAHNATALGAQATLVAVTGHDGAAAVLTEACREAGIAPSFAGDPRRPTTTKVRLVTERNQQVARIDYELDLDVSGDIEQRLIADIRTHAPRASAVVVSDYLKGAVTRPVIEACLAATAATGAPLLVDPKIPHLDLYAGATLVTPNHHEAEAATQLRVRSHDEARAAARVFRERARCHGVMITRGDQGVWLLTDTAEGHLPASAREVSDVTGAGDTVIATLAVAMASGATMAEAAHLANQAAGLAVAKFGAATVSQAELLRAFDTAAAV
jgi:D-beta-D-heptose 7-phosphate kinase/D-beta-D-heptose 1-phosphate adenosyltransferase